MMKFTLFETKMKEVLGFCGIKGQSKMFSDWTTPTSKLAGTISFRVVRFRGVTWWSMVVPCLEVAVVILFQELDILTKVFY